MKSGATHTMKDGTVHTRAQMAAEKSKAPMAKGGYGMRHGGTVKGRK